MLGFGWLLPLLVLLGGGKVDCPPGPAPVVLDPSYEHDRWVTGPSDHRAEFGAFTVSFDTADDNDGDGRGERWGTPEWVAYEVKRLDPARKSDVERPRPWYTDEALAAEGIAPEDDSYLHSGWSRGHLCMLDHAERVGAMAACNTCITLNACPQDQAFNAGIWLHLENLTAAWADRYGRVWVICGPVFYDRRPSQWIGGEGRGGAREPDELPVALPDGFFKILVRESEEPGRPHVLAFLYPHNHPALSYQQDSTDVDQRFFLTSVDAIEFHTGLDFLTVLEDGVEAEIEMPVAAELWPE